MKKTKFQKELKKSVKQACSLYLDAFGLAHYEHYTDFSGDPIFYHPTINEIRVWAQFKVLMPEEYGWIVVGEL